MDLGRRDVQLAAETRADLRAIGAYLGAPLAGRLSAKTNAAGAVDAIAVDGSATLELPAYRAESAERAALDVHLRGLGGGAPGGEARLDATRFRHGTGAPYDVRADATWRRRGGSDDLQLSGNARSDDGRTQQLEVAATRTAARTKATLRTLVLAPPDGSPWRLVRPADLTLDSAIATDGLELAAGKQRVALEGRVALVAQGTSDVRATLTDVDLAPVCALSPLHSCAGALSGRAALRGTPAAPVAEVSAAVERVEFSKVAYGSVTLESRYADRRAHVESTLRHPDAGALQVRGEVPIDLAWMGTHPDLGGAPLALEATADRLDLTIAKAFAPRAIVASAGRLSLDAHVAGTRSEPRVTGELALDDGRIELAATGIPYENIRARVGTEGDRLVVREFDATAGDGRAQLAGSAGMPPGPANLDLALRLSRFLAVRRDAYEGAATGEISVRGALDAPDVSGTVKVDRAVVRPAGLRAGGPAVPHDPTITVVAAVETPLPEPPAEPETPIAGALTLGVTIEIENNAWIRREDADIEIAGKLHVKKARNDQVRIVGEIRLLRGWYAFQGRRFKLVEGTITFTGATPPKPVYDITATHKAGEYEIEVRITGSGDKPNLKLSSTPPLEQADILAVLLFGKPANQLGHGQTVALQEKALQLAAGYVVPELRVSVMEALGLDTLEVELPEGTEAGRVSAGRYVSDDVFVSLAQEFGRRAAQVVAVEYALRPNVSVRGETSTRGNSALDLFWRYRY